jgi:GNAT superfamily N-acetyltransferase
VTTQQGAAGGAPGAPDGRPGVRFTVEPYESPDSQRLVAELMADLDARYAADGPAEGDNPEMVGRYAVRGDQVTPPHGVFVVARIAGEPVGCGAARALLDGPAGVVEIKRMYIVPEARRRGLSRQLLARLESEAGALGYRRVQLETGLRQPEAIALYESAGYHRIASFGQYAGDDLSICFAKDLGGR